MKLKISAFFIVFFFYLNGSISAQELFSKVHFKNYTEILASSVISTHDSSYFLTGARDGQNYVMKVDSNGDQIWSKTMGNGYVAQGEIIELKDSTFLYATSLNNTDVLCVNFDTNGDTLWSSAIHVVNPVQIHSVLETSEGGFVILGDISTNFASGMYRIVIIKLDVEGNLEWGKAYTTVDYLNWAYSIKETQDMGYIVTGFFYDQNVSDGQTFLMKTDSQGLPQWAKSYNSINCSSSQGFDVLVEDEGFLLTISTCGLPHVLKTDTYGNAIWMRWYYYPEEYDAYGTCNRRIIETSDTTYTLISSNNLITIHEAGDLLWGTFFYMYLMDFAYSVEGGYLVVGNGPIIGVNSRITNDPQIGIVKTDIFGQTNDLCSGMNLTFSDTVGCLMDDINFNYQTIGSISNIYPVIESKSHYVESGCVAFIGNTEEIANNSILRLYPNPTRGTINISSDKINLEGHIVIYDVFGSYILSTEIKGNKLIDLTQNPDGIYFLKYSGKELSITEKLILRK